VTYLKENFEFD